MTPQPEQEYIITKSRAREISKRYNFPALVEQMVEEVCSRPNTPIPSSTDKLTTVFNFGDFNNNAMEWLKQHDIAIRNEVLDEFLSKAQHIADTIPNFNRMDYMHFLKESLRTKERAP